MTPSTKPVTRLTSAWVRDQGMRPIVATIVGSVLELRTKGRRKVETLDLASLYFQAVKARVIAERKAKREARSKKR